MVNWPSLHPHARLAELYLNDNWLTAIPERYFDGMHTLRVLSLGNNMIDATLEKTALGIIWSGLRLLNVSNNPDLTSANDSTWPGHADLKVLDISSTRILVTTHLCRSGINIFASKTPQLQPEATLRMLQACSKKARLLDIYNNNVSLLEAGLSNSYEELHIGEQEETWYSLAFRLQTSDSPVKCSLLQGLRYVDADTSNKARDASSSSKLTPVLQYRCHCSRGYVQGDNGMCTLFWGTARIASLVVGTGILVVLCTIGLTMYNRRLRRRRRALAFDLDLHKGLLEETAGDVLALTRAWEIEWADLALVTRIDQGAEGAFGKVIIILTILPSARQLSPLIFIHPYPLNPARCIMFVTSHLTRPLRLIPSTPAPSAFAPHTRHHPHTASLSPPSIAYPDISPSSPWSTLALPSLIPAGVEGHLGPHGGGRQAAAAEHTGGGRKRRGRI